MNLFTSNALTLLDGWREGYPACKKKSSTSNAWNLFCEGPGLTWTNLLINRPLNKAKSRSDGSYFMQHVISKCIYTAWLCPRGSEKLLACGNEQSAQKGRKHCALAVVRWSQKSLPLHRHPFPGARDGQNLISWRWSLPLRAGHEKRRESIWMVPGI